MDEILTLLTSALQDHVDRERSFVTKFPNKFLFFFFAWRIERNTRIFMYPSGMYGGVVEHTPKLSEYSSHHNVMLTVELTKDVSSLFVTECQQCWVWVRSFA